MENQSKKITKRMLRTKLLLALIIAIIMIPLIVLYCIFGDTSPKTKLYDKTVSQPVEETSQPAAEPETQEEQQTTQPVSEPSTTSTDAPKTAQIFSITDTDNWFLAIINTEHPLPDGYVPTLSAVIETSNIQIDSRISSYYSQMYLAAKQSGCILTPYSAYHTYSLQESTYSRKVNYYINQGLSSEQAKEKASQSVLPAGCSEHNAGISVDIVSASTDFANTKEYLWLCENAQDYGFILRYPENKTDITGVNFEPWHWRYVGTEAAKEIKKSGQCLEEYLGLT